MCARAGSHSGASGLRNAADPAPGSANSHPGHTHSAGGHAVLAPSPPTRAQWFGSWRPLVDARELGWRVGDHTPYFSHCPPPAQSQKMGKRVSRVTTRGPITIPMPNSAL